MQRIARASHRSTRPPDRGPGADERARHGARPASLHLLVALLLLLALNALVGGTLLIVDPSGGLLGMPVALLAPSPFRDYLLPGLVLFAALGVAPLVVATAAWARPGWAYLPRTGVGVAGIGASGVGVFLIVWILVQMTILRFFLQPVLLALGTAIVILSLLPSVRRDLGRASGAVSERR